MTAVASLYYFETQRYDSRQISVDTHSYEKTERAGVVEEYEMYYGKGGAPEWLPSFPVHLPPTFFSSHQYNFASRSHREGHGTSYYVNAVPPTVVYALGGALHCPHWLMTKVAQWSSTPWYNGVLYRFDETGILTYVHLNFENLSQIEVPWLLSHIGESPEAFIQATRDQLHHELTVDEVSGLVRFSVSSQAPNRMDIQLGKL